MSILRKLITPFADDIMVKLMEHKDFPEEKYDIVIQNKKLQSELAATQSKHYNILLSENTKMREEIDRLKDEKMKKLEIENGILKLELGRSKNNVFLLEEDTEEIDPTSISKFMYGHGMFKFIYDNGTVRTKQLTEEKFKDIMKRVFPSARLHLLGTELHVMAYSNETPLGSLILDLHEYTSVEKIDDWIEDKINMPQARLETPQWAQF